MTDVETMADQVGVQSAAGWAAQQPLFRVRTNRPLLRVAIEKEAARLMTLPQPGGLLGRYHPRKWVIESHRGSFGVNYATTVEWSHHRGFFFCDRNTGPYVGDGVRAATPGEVFQAISDMQCRVEFLRDQVRLGLETAADSPSHPEYRRIFDLYQHAVGTAMDWFGVNYLLAIRPGDPVPATSYSY